jgi:hypothetical protein
MDRTVLDCQDLLTMSKMSETAIAGWVNINQDQMPLVAVADWILPKDAFVMLWFWFMLDAKVYNKYWDHHTWDPVIHALNEHLIKSHAKLRFWDSQWLSHCYQHVVTHYQKCNWSLEQKASIFQQVVVNLQQA